MNNDRQAAGSRTEAHFDNKNKSRVKHLLEQYPNTSRDENAEILAVLSDGPLLDIGSLKGDETVRYKIAAFEDEHRKAFRTTPMQIAVLLVVFVIAALACSMLWDIGR